MTTVYLALGSNLGNRLENLKFAIERFGQTGIIIEAKSKIYEAQSVGTGGEGDFYNAVIRAQTSLTPQQLLEVCAAIEEEAGRESTPRGVHRKGERVLDIDILMFGNLFWKSLELEIPHPRALHRNFVLAPLLDVLQGGWIRETKEKF